MVLNNDPRKVLELFNKPVDRDEDEFLDNINSQEKFGAMPSAPVESLDSLQEMSQKQRRFFALFKDTLNESDIQASVPDELDLAAVKKVMSMKELPNVAVSKEDKEAQLEDLARRAAYLAMQEKVTKDEKYKEYHDRFIATYYDLYKKEKKDN
eukprot:jgi/Picre1/32439/NNA_007785.t1